MSESKRAKRVAIAKDVLKHLKTTKVATGDYINGELSDLNGQAKQHIKKLRRCEVCALGAMMISHIDLYNKCSISDLWLGYDDTIRKKLSNYFSKRQLSMIETTFEGEDISNDFSYFDRDYLACLNIFDRYTNAKNRLRVIMLNVVKNGEFKPRLQKIS